SGTIQREGGTFTLSGADRLGNSSTVNVNGGTLDVATFNDTVNGVTLTAGSITGTTGTLTSSTAFDVRSGTIAAKLGGTNGLTKTTTGTVTLAGINTYTGATTIVGGTLQVNGAITSSVAVGSAGTLAGSGRMTGNVTGAG